VHRLQATEPSTQPAAPAGLTRVSVGFDPAVESERKEWFLRGTEMGVVESNASGADHVSMATPRIGYPAADTIIALDPDSPPGSQRVVFEASPAIGGLGWQLDGATLPNTDAYGRADWTPTPGKHSLALIDVDGRTLAMVAFEVLGNSVR